MIKSFLRIIFVLSFTVQAYSALALSAEYRMGGANPEALLCRPEGKGPFPAVVHNHGVGVDTVGYQKAVRHGYDVDFRVI